MPLLDLRRFKRAILSISNRNSGQFGWRELHVCREGKYPTITVAPIFCHIRVAPISHITLLRSATAPSAVTSLVRITARAVYPGKDRPQTMVFDLDWGRIDDGVWKLTPSGIGIRKPLQVGKEWRSDGNAMNLRSGIPFRATGVAKVTGQEPVTTPAGTFDTFRVDMTVRLINARDQTKSSTWTFVVWYAPAINRWAKRKTEGRFEGRLRDSFSEELTEYSRKP